jgi:hypothetical protein
MTLLTSGLCGVSADGRTAARFSKTIFSSTDPFQIDDFAHVRVHAWIAGQNNSSLQRVEGSAQRGLIKSI